MRSLHFILLSVSRALIFMTMHHYHHMKQGLWRMGWIYCNRRVILNSLGVRTFFWTWLLCYQTKASSIAKWTHCSQRYFYAFLIIPPKEAIQLIDKLFQRNTVPRFIVEHFIF